MKLRNGFVSNSSSSSFLLITTLEGHDKILEKMRKEEDGDKMAEIINSLVGRKKLGNTDLVVFGQGSGDDWEGHGPIQVFERFDNKPASIWGLDVDSELRWSAEEIYPQIAEELKVPRLTQSFDT